MRVLVTGAGGFIGGHLCTALRAHGHEVLSGVERAQAVVHLANIAHTRAPEEELQRVNVDGTLRCARESARAGARRFVYLSSALAASTGDAYGRAKVAAERGLGALSGIEVVVLRPPLVYGPRVKANFLALMRAVARGIPLPLASVTNLRSFVYVGNLVDAIERCLEAPQARGRIYDVSDGAPVSTPQLCRSIGAALGRPARLFPFPTRLLEALSPLRKLTQSLVVDGAPLRGELGWKPPYTFDEGIRATADWYRASGG